MKEFTRDDDLIKVVDALFMAIDGVEVQRAFQAIQFVNQVVAMQAMTGASQVSSQQGPR